MTTLSTIIVIVCIPLELKWIPVFLLNVFVSILEVEVFESM